MHGPFDDELPLMWDADMSGCGRATSLRRHALRPQTARRDL